MEKKPPLVMTPFDESLTNDFLQLVKIILPYLPDHVQRIAGIYVKLTELMNAFYCFLIIIIAEGGYESRRKIRAACLKQLYPIFLLKKEKCSIPFPEYGK